MPPALVPGRRCASLRAHDTQHRGERNRRAEGNLRPAGLDGGAQRDAGRADGGRQDLDRAAAGGPTRPALPRRRCRDRAGRRLHHRRAVRAVRRARVPRRRAPGDPPPAGRRPAGAGHRRRRLDGPRHPRHRPARGGDHLAALPPARAAAPRRRAHQPPAAERAQPRGGAAPADRPAPPGLCRSRHRGGLQRRQPGRHHHAGAAGAARVHAAAAAVAGAGLGRLRRGGGRGAARPGRGAAGAGAAAEARGDRHRRDGGAAAPARPATRPGSDRDRNPQHHRAARRDVRKAWRPMARWWTGCSPAAWSGAAR